MIRILKFEFSRAFRSPGFFLSIIVGILIALSQWIFRVLPYSSNMDNWMALSKEMVYPMNIYSSWIGASSSLYSYLFFLILPLIVTLPYGGSFFNDIKSNAINFICTRTEIKKYYYSKFIVTFVSGGSVAVIPLISNLILCAQVVPVIKPEVANYTSPMLPRGSFSTMSFEYPALFMLISLVMIFFYGGTLAVFSLNTAYFTNHLFIVLLSPTILNLFISSICSLLNIEAWEPVNFLHPAFAADRITPFLIEAGIIIFVSIYEFIIRGRKLDIC